jgi:hypothetical protein
MRHDLLMFAGGDAFPAQRTKQPVPVVEQTSGSDFATYVRPSIVFECAS